MLVTFLCPTRGKPKQFERSMRSIGPRYQVLAYVDEDDETFRYDDYPGFPGVVEYVVGPRYGYPQLHEAIGNHLIPKAKGDWLFLWNDDAIMKTPGWDLILRSEPCDRVLCPQSPQDAHRTGINVFPIVPRAWADVAGWAKNGANDTWWQVVGGMINRHKNIDIMIEHTPTDSAKQGYDSRTFFSLECYAKMGFAAGRIHQEYYK